MRFDVITLFPELFAPFLSHGINRRAFESRQVDVRQVDVRLWQLRDFAEGNYRRVDDRPFGGGPGMVMQADPIYRCWQAIRADRAAAEADPVPTVLFSPLGERLAHPVVERFCGGQGAILVCGRYEGLDQRFIDACVDVQISLGDFVLSGGEIAAMALLDSVARLQPGVLNDAGSHQQDSFNPALDGLLDCPHYTRPEVWQGPDGQVPVPPVLLSGHHGQIEAWRRQQRLRQTAQCRPDVLDSVRERGALSRADLQWLREQGLDKD